MKRFRVLRFRSLVWGLVCLLMFAPLNNVLAQEKLPQGEWAPKAYAALSALIRQYGKNNIGYNVDKKPYVVFDFDNTTAINDVEETLLAYQLDNLYFKILPNEMFEVLTSGISDLHKPLDDYQGALGGRKVTLAMMARDIADDYTFLYWHYKGLKGKMSLSQIRQTPQFLDFRAKIRFLYFSVYNTYDASVGYFWPLYLFKGMTVKELQRLTLRSVDYWLTQPFGEVKWESPSMGKAGRVWAPVKTGFAISPEMKSLYGTLRANGIDVYICSASLRDVVAAVATNAKYGLGLRDDHVVAMMLRKDAHTGRFVAERDVRYPMPCAEGKVEAIKKLIAPSHHGEDPLLVGGDSDGDYNMLTEFNGLKCGLIINRLSKDKISRLYYNALFEPYTRYVLQGRNDNIGVFIPNEKSILLGSSEPSIYYPQQ